jgi:hypothetical protein
MIALLSVGYLPYARLSAAFVAGTSLSKLQKLLYYI